MKRPLFKAILFFSMVIPSYGQEVTLEMINKAHQKIFYAQQAIDFLQFDLDREEAFSKMVMNRTTMEDIRRHRSANLANKENILSKLEAYPSDFSKVIRIFSEEISKDREIMGLSSRLGKSLQITRDRLLSGIEKKKEALEELATKLKALQADLERMKDAYYGTGKGAGK